MNSADSRFEATTPTAPHGPCPDCGWPGGSPHFQRASRRLQPHRLILELVPRPHTDIWPAFDPESEGLVTLQVAWISEDGNTPGEMLSPLDTGLGPGKTKN